MDNPLQFKRTKLKNSEINIKMSKLYHYQLPKHGYCFYNFNNILTDVSNGYIIVNLNDIIYPKDLQELFNSDQNIENINYFFNNKKKNVLYSMKKSLEYWSKVYNYLNMYQSQDYQVIYYLSIYKFIKLENNDEASKDTIIKKCNDIINVIQEYISRLNIMISYQYDNFHLKRTYFNEFINNYIKSKMNYLSVNFENNKYLVGKSNDIIIDNNFTNKNNNLVSCYKNEFQFICMNAIKNINIFNNHDQIKLPEKKLKSLVSKLYESKVSALKENSSEFKGKLFEAIMRQNTNIKNFFQAVFNLHNSSETKIYGFNLDLNLDYHIIESLKTLVKNNNNTNIQEINNSSNFAMNIVSIFNNKSNNINLIDFNNINNTSLKNLNEIQKLINKTSINVILGTNLTIRNFKNIISFFKNKFEFDNIYFDFDINKRVRISLAYKSYFYKFTENNLISNKKKYENNKKKYDKLIKFINYVNSKKDNDGINDEFCNCNNNLNYYKVGDLPFFDNKDAVIKYDYDLF